MAKNPPLDDYDEVERRFERDYAQMNSAHLAGCRGC
jgi:hypothetical protein